MRNFYLFISFVLLVIFTNSCVYTDIQMPMDTDFDKTTLGTKEGKSSTYSVLYMVTWGDAGSKSAATDGDIEVITHADRQVFSVLFGLYSKVSTVVYGD